MLRNLSAVAALAALPLAAAEATTATPLSKVVGLLKNMKAQIEKEVKQDAEIFDKMACWCHTNREEKTQAVADETQLIEELKASIGELTGKHSSLEAEIKRTKEDIAADEQALEEATSVREKEAAAAHQGESDSIQALGQLKGAITVLKKLQGAALNQETITNLKAMMRSASVKFPAIVSSEDTKTVSSLLQARPYANQSGEIFGFIAQMKEQMEKDLSEAQAAEMKSQQSFEELRTAKKEELKSARILLDSKEDQFADTGLKLAQAKDDLVETEDQLATDQEFLVDLEKRCAANEGEATARATARTAEIAAINDTIGILTADEARDVAARSLGKTAFVQIRMTQEKMLRATVAKKLRAVASRVNSPEMSMLATSVQLDAFGKVYKAIDGMIGALKTEQEDEVKHKDFCNAEFHDNAQMTTDKQRHLDQLGAKREELESDIKSFSDAISALKAEIANMRLELQRATNDRKAENAEFRQTVADQTATQQIIDKALDRMRAYYGKSSFLQQGQPGLNKDGYKKNAGSGGVLAMLEEVKGDSKQMQAEATKDEQNAQTAYEQFNANTNKSVNQKAKAIVDNTANRAQADKDLVQTKENQSATLTTLEKLAEYKTDLHAQCDFHLKNFEVRQTARSEEIEALQQAKQILRGSQ